MKSMFRVGISNDPGWPVSRILSSGKPAWMDIYLG